MSLTVTLNGIEYVRADSVLETPKGDRRLVIIDRGWMIAGDVEERDGMLYLHRPVMLAKFSGTWLDGAISDPQSSDVTLKKLPGPAEVPFAAVLFRIPVSVDWGL